MTNDLQKCPAKNDLLDFLLGNLPPQDLQSVENHVSSCDLCEDTIRSLSPDDTFTELARNAFDLVPPAGGDQHVVESLIDRMTSESRVVQPNLETNRQLDDRAAEVSRLLAPARCSDSIGQLAHYKIIRLIGAGSTGVVYQAEDTTLRRLVALKILRPSLGQAARERFMEEARIAASIDHPNVVTIYQVGIEGQLAFMAMQWNPGETLERRLLRQSVMTETKVRKLGLQIANGLTAAHAKNLIHRDIKPANIWLVEETDQAKILDFGLARIADDDPQMTSTGMLAGTPNFMSPEQTRGLELDGRSDLFSLGCLMYRASTGKLPFGSTGILATLQSIQNDHPRPPCKTNPNLSENFSNLIMGLLEKQPINRVESATMLARALGDENQQWPFVSQSTSETQPAAQPFKTSSRFNWIGWITAAVVVAFLGWGGYQFGDQVIRIVTDQGQLVIETNDENVEVEILQNGQQVAIIDTETNQRINIRSGSYEIKASDGNNEFKVSPEKVTMSRGGKQIVSIEMIDSQSVPIATNSAHVPPTEIKSPNDIPLPPNASTETGDEPIYQGKTFDQWMRVSRIERSPEAIQEALMALTELSKDKPAKTDEFIDQIVRPLLRNHEYSIYIAEYPVLEKAISSFRFMPSGEIVDFIETEFKQGNANSQQALERFLNIDLNLDGIYDGADEKLRWTLIRRAPGLTRNLLDHQKDLINRNASNLTEQGIGLTNFLSALWRTLVDHQQYMPGVGFGVYDQRLKINLRSDEMKELVEEIQQEYNRATKRLENNPEQESMVYLTTALLLRLAPDDDVIERASELALNQKLPRKFRLELIYALTALPKQQSQAAVVGLRKLHEQNDANLGFGSIRNLVIDTLEKFEVSTEGMERDPIGGAGGGGFF